MYSEEQVGAVTAVFAPKGYGFIKGDDGQTYFFHVYEISRTQERTSGEIFDRLKIGDRVKFFPEVVKSYTDKKGVAHEDGLRAVRVRPC